MGNWLGNGARDSHLGAFPVGLILTSPKLTEMEGNWRGGMEGKHGDLRDFLNIGNFNFSKRGNSGHKEARTKDCRPSGVHADRRTTVLVLVVPGTGNTAWSLYRENYESRTKSEISTIFGYGFFSCFILLFIFIY